MKQRKGKKHGKPARLDTADSGGSVNPAQRHRIYVTSSGGRSPSRLAAEAIVRDKGAQGITCYITERDDGTFEVTCIEEGAPVRQGERGSQTLHGEDSKAAKVARRR